MTVIRQPRSVLDEARFNAVAQWIGNRNLTLDARMRRSMCSQIGITSGQLDIALVALSNDRRIQLIASHGSIRVEGRMGSDGQS